MGTLWGKQSWIPREAWTDQPDAMVDAVKRNLLDDAREAGRVPDETTAEVRVIDPMTDGAMLDGKPVELSFHEQDPERYPDPRTYVVAYASVRVQP